MTGRELYHYRISNGLCTKCGDPVGDAKGRMCNVCVKLDRIKDNERRKKFTSYQKRINAERCQAWRNEHKDYAKIRYAKMKEQGLCVQCGRPNDTDRARCPQCLEYQKFIWNTTRGKGNDKRKEA